MTEHHLQHPGRGASVAPKRLMLLVTIVQKGKGTFFSDFLQQTFEANMQICVVGTGTALRGVVICFYLSNEGLSLLENAAYIGLPVPEKLKDILE